MHFLQVFFAKQCTESNLRICLPILIFFRKCNISRNIALRPCIDDINTRSGELERKLPHGLVFCDVESSPILSCVLTDALKNGPYVFRLIKAAQMHNLLVQIKIFQFLLVLSVVLKRVTQYPVV